MDPHTLAVFSEVASDDCQQCLAGMRVQQDNSVVVTLYPISFFVEFLVRWWRLSTVAEPSPPPNTDDDVEKSSSPGRITVEGDLGTAR